MPINREKRNAVWETYYGHCDEYECYCCRTRLSRLDFECAHVQARAWGGRDNIENLRPVCHDCNQEMGITHMFEYMHKKNWLPSVIDPMFDDWRLNRPAEARQRFERLLSKLSEKLDYYISVRALMSVTELKPEETLRIKIMSGELDRIIILLGKFDSNECTLRVEKLLRKKLLADSCK